MLQQISATREATRTLRNFEAEGDFEGEMQAIHASVVDDCIVSLVKAIQVLREHSLSDLQDLVGIILVMVDDTRETDAPPYKRRRTRGDEESGEDRNLSDDEPDNDIGDDVLAHDVEREAPESGDDEPWDGITDAMLAQDVHGARGAGFSAGFSSAQASTPSLPGGALCRDPNPDPNPHPISIRVPCDLHGAPQWHVQWPNNPVCHGTRV